VPRVKYAMNYRPKNSFSMSYASRKVIFPGAGGSTLEELPFFNGCESMTSQLVKLRTVIELQDGEEAAMERLEDVAVVAWQVEDNNIVLHSIVEELNANMRTKGIQLQEMRSPIRTISVSFLSSMWQGSYTAAVSGSKS
jgi:hypothetical protein